MVAQECTFTKCKLAYFKGVNCMVFNLYLNKGVKKNASV